MILPAELTTRLEGQLGARGLAEFEACLDGESKPGLRLNTLKGQVPELTELLPFRLEPVPWAPAGFVFPIEERPGKLPFYQAGLYYLQEPSAMAPAAVLDVKPGERVLDLCAAPGGKTTQLASAMAGKGLLVANDNNQKRMKALIWNLEHWGATNAVAVNEEPERLSAAFPGYFDRILVDAPCSGEGMLRKDPKALAGWRKHNGRVCRETQDRLLDQAAAMLAPGGKMVYSTCTFNPLENEEAVAAFLERQPAFRLLPLPLYDGWRADPLLKGCRQLWPHLADGEGQFLALMEKAGSSPAAGESGEGAAKTRRDRAGSIPKPGGGETPGEIEPFFSFMEENFNYPLKGPFAIFNGHVYRTPADLPDMSGLRVARPGWYLGLIRNGRFYPSQPLAMGMDAKQMKRRLDLEPGGEDVERYLRGETLMTAGEKGWTLVTLAGFPLGFGKQTGDYIKNEYASGWRLI